MPAAARPALWAGSTISGIGDGLTTVSLIWIVYALSGSVRSVSVLVIVSTAPPLAGGFAMGALLDRADRRRTLLAVNAVLGTAVGSVPLLHALGRLEVWNLYVVGRSTASPRWRTSPECRRSSPPSSRMPT
jgi:MFS family permease